MPGTKSLVEGTSAAGPIYYWQDLVLEAKERALLCAGACSVEVGVGRPSSRVGEEMGSALEDIPGTGGEETTAEIAAVDSTPRTSRHSRRLS